MWVTYENIRVRIPLENPSIRMTETRLYEPARLSTPPEQTAGYLRSSKVLIHVLATQTDITDDRQNLPLIAVERKYRI